MTRRTLPFLAFVLLLTMVSVVPAQASPDRQDPDDAVIRRVLTAAAEDLGWDPAVESDISEAGVPEWWIWGHNASFQVIGYMEIEAFSSPAEANASLQVYEGQASSYSFHGYPAVSAPGDAFQGAVFQAGRFVFGFSSKHSTNGLDFMYQHAVAEGLIPAGPGDSTPAPAITPTPGLESTITLRAYAEGYGELTEMVDNSAGLGSIAISGTVTDAASGAPVEGAVVEITSGANLAAIQTGPDGAYRLTASVPGGENSGLISGVDFALPAQSELAMDLKTAQTELVADGVSSTEVTLQVKDLQGQPVKDRSFTLSVEGEVGPGTIQPDRATTDENGLIRATYTSFQVPPGPEPDNPRHEIVIKAEDQKTGEKAFGSIFVNQYQLTVLGEEYIPACTRCNFPAKITVMVTDYWSTPISDLALNVQLEGGTPGGSLVLDPSSQAQQSNLQLSTNSQGVAEVYFKWLGSVDLKEALQEVVITDGVTQVQTRKAIKVQGLDLALARVEEAGFTGVTGQQAFFKIYFKDLAHPDLPLSRFNAESPNKLGLRVTIRQYHSDGVNKSLTFEQTGGWGQDEKGKFVEMYGTPRMPAVVPRNDGTSWYEVRVDPVVDDDVFLPDLYRANNDTIMAVTTGSPDGWLHIWLQDGVLTPHSYTGVIFKCVGRFLPGLGNAMTVIDTLNQVYKLDALGLGQSTSAVISEKLQKKSASKALTKFKAGTINNVLSCVQDTVAVYGERNRGSSLSGKVCAALIFPPHYLGSASDAGETGPALDKGTLDRFVQGMLLDSPDQLGVVVYGLERDRVTLTDASGNVVHDPDRMSGEGQVVVYILPGDQDFQLEVESDKPFEIGVYSPGSDPDQRTTIRQEVDPQTALTANMDIGGGADYTLELDQDRDGTPDQTQDPDVMALDVVKPEITELGPPNGASISSDSGIIQVRFRDNTGGAGIDPGATLISVNGENLTAQANIALDSLLLPLFGLDPGEHSARLVVVDKAGNAVVKEWSFVISEGFAIPPAYQNVVIALAGGIAVITLLVAVIAIYRVFRPRKRISGAAGKGRIGKTDQIQDANRTLKARTRRRWSWVLGLAVSSVIILFVAGGISLVAFQFFPGMRLKMGPGDPTKILQNGGGGVLASILGFFLIRGGFKAVITRRVVIDDEFEGRREKRGCSAVLNGLVQLFFGIVILTGGVGLVTLVIYQEVIPYLGF